ncbi:13204_t:CDS:1 [Racocetra persica]|uniref:13204_t:CDS:1 n=1 Tax=Racocetra persica TaxID=160502 RepID=A0ACA9LKS3_9GLOM|nr:13204_t:CDS:1 [Racocetra persica]
MRNIYYLAKCEQALNQYLALYQLGNLQLKNLNKLCYKTEPQVLKSNILFLKEITLKQAYSSYENSVLERSFLESIAFVIECEVINEILASKNWSLMIDESTSFIAKYFAIVSKHISENQPVLCYLKLVELDNCSAEAIMNDLNCFIIAKSIDINNLIHFGSDSASTMLENQTGIATQLKKINLYITENHCIAYHLYLACKDTAKKIQYF